MLVPGTYGNVIDGPKKQGKIPVPLDKYFELPDANFIWHYHDGSYAYLRATFGQGMNSILIGQMKTGGFEKLLLQCGIPPWFNWKP